MKEIRLPEVSMPIDKFTQQTAEMRNMIGQVSSEFSSMADQIQKDAADKVVKSINEMSGAIEQAAKGKNMSKYWKNQESLINDVVDIYGQLSRATSRVDKDNLSTELYKTVNALKALSGADFNEIKGISRLTEALDYINKKTFDIDISSDFSVKEFEKAFDVFNMLEKAGMNVKTVFDSIGKGANYDKLKNEVNDLNRELERTRDRLDDLEYSDLGELRKKVNNLSRTARAEFETFLSAMDIDPDDYRFDYIFDQIRDGTMTSKEAIQEVKREFDYLLQNTRNNGGTNVDIFNNSNVREFVLRLEEAVVKIEEVAYHIKNLSDTNTNFDDQFNFGDMDANSLKTLFVLLQNINNEITSIAETFRKINDEGGLKVLTESAQAGNASLNLTEEQIESITSAFEGLRYELSEIRKAFGTIDDENGFKPLIQSISEMNRVLQDIPSTISKINQNISLDFGVDNSKDVQQADKQAEIYLNSVYDNLMNRYKKFIQLAEKNSIMHPLTAIWGKSNALQAGYQSSDDFINKFSMTAINQLPTVQDRIYTLIELMNILKDIAAENKGDYGFLSEITKVNKKNDLTNIKTVQKNLKEIYDLKNHVSGENPLENIFGNLKGIKLEELTSEIDKILNKLTEISELLETGFKITDITSEVKDTKGLDKEGNAVTTLEQKIKDVTDAVNLKTQAFKKEELQVRESIGKEINSLVHLIEKLNEVREAVLEIGKISVPEIKVGEVNLNNDASQTEVLSGTTAPLQTVENKLNEVEEQASETETAIKNVFRAFNSERGEIGENGISWFTDSLKNLKSYLAHDGRDSVISTPFDFNDFLVVDAKGANYKNIEFFGDLADENTEKIKNLYYQIEQLREKLWDQNLPTDEYEKLAEELHELESQFKKLNPDAIFGQKSTDDIANYAKSKGYKGVVFENIIDDSLGVSNELSTTVAIFDSLPKDINNVTNEVLELKNAFIELMKIAKSGDAEAFNRLVDTLNNGFNAIGGYKVDTSKESRILEANKPKVEVNQTPLSSAQDPLSAQQTSEDILTEGQSADSASASMDKLAKSKKEVKEENEKLAKSAKNTAKEVKGEGKAVSDASALMAKNADKAVEAFNSMSPEQVGIRLQEIIDGSDEAVKQIGIVGEKYVSAMFRDGNAGMQQITWTMDEEGNYQEQISPVITNFEQLEKQVIKSQSKLMELRNTLKLQREEAKKSGVDYDETPLRNRIKIEKEYLRNLLKEAEIYAESEAYLTKMNSLRQEMKENITKKRSELDIKTANKDLTASVRQKKKDDAKATADNNKRIKEANKLESAYNSIQRVLNENDNTKNPLSGKSLIEANNKLNTLRKNLDNFKNDQGYDLNKKLAVDTALSDLKEFIKLSRQTDNVSSGALEAKKVHTQYEVSESKLNKLKETMNDLGVSSKKLQDSIKEIEDELKNSGDSNKESAKGINEINNQFAIAGAEIGYLKAKKLHGDRTLRVQNRVASETEKLSNLKQELKDAGLLTEELSQRFEELEESLKKVKTQSDLTTWRGSKGGLVNTAKTLLKDSETDVKKSNKLLEQQKTSWEKVWKLKLQISKLDSNKASDKKRLVELKAQLAAERENYQAITLQLGQYDEIIDKQKQRNELLSVGCSYQKQMGEIETITAEEEVQKELERETEYKNKVSIKSYDNEIVKLKEINKLEIANLSAKEKDVAANKVRIDQLKKEIQAEQEYRKAMGYETEEGKSRIINTTTTLQTDLETERKAVEAANAKTAEEVRNKWVKVANELKQRLQDALTNYGAGAEQGTVDEVNKLIAKLNVPNVNYTVDAGNVADTIRKTTKDVNQLEKSLKQEDNKTTKFIEQDDKNIQNKLYQEANDLLSKTIKLRKELRRLKTGSDEKDQVRADLIKTEYEYTKKIAEIEARKLKSDKKDQELTRKQNVANIDSKQYGRNKSRKAKENDIKINNKISETNAEIDKLRNLGKTNAYAEYFKEAEVQIEKANDKLKSEGISGLTEYNNTIKKIKSNLNERKDAIMFFEPGNLEKAKLEMEAYAAIISNGKAELISSTYSGDKNTYKWIDEQNGQIHKLTLSYNNLNGVLSETHGMQKQIESSGLSLSSMFKQGVVNLTRYLMTFASFYDIINKIRQGITIIRELDTALTEMRKVSDESIQSLKNFQKASFDIAKTVGTTAKEIQNSTADFMRLGESLEEAAKSAEVANILLNVSEFESIDEATESLVSMAAAYDELEKIDIVDKLNIIGNNFAISTDGLATALQNSASALKTAKNDIDESIALATAANAVVQDPDKVGAGLRTIALRITGTEAAKEELAELGEDVDDFVITTSSKLNQQVKDLTKVVGKEGISLLDDNGNYRSTYEILQDIADVWEQIAEEDLATGENRQNALLEMLAGKNRSNILASILQNPSTLREAYETSVNDSAGSAQRELEKYLDSIEGKIAQFQNEVQKFWYNLISSKTVKWIIDLGTKVIKILGKITDGLGEVGTAAVTIFAGLKLKNFVKGEKSGGRAKLNKITKQ